MDSIRQHIINLIRQYIYTNGAQKITGAQLQEILLEIANAFALSGGIDTVLAAGSTVSNGRVITNEKKGTFRLDAELLLEKEAFKYIGFDVLDTELASATYNARNFAITGTVKRNNASRPIFDVLTDGLEKGEIKASTAHVIEHKTGSGRKDGDPVARTSVAAEEPEPYLDAEISSVVKTVDNFSSHRIQLFRVESEIGDAENSVAHRVTNESVSSAVQAYMESNHTEVYQTKNEITHYVQTGPQASSHIQRGMSIEASAYDGSSQGYTSVLSHLGAAWRDYSSVEIARINESGVGLAYGKRLTLTKTGSAPTAGVAKLVAGSVNVTTNAVRSNSVISISVQEEGSYSGRIRVASKTEKTGFSLSSSNDADTCTVFWQIIDLE